MSSTSGLIVVGSGGIEQAKSVEYYDEQADNWFESFKIDTDDRIDFKSALLDDKLILVGGEKDGEVVTTVTSYDFANGEVSTLPSMSLGARNMAIAVVAHHLYIIGGYNGRTLDRVERYSPLKQEWQDVEPMKTRRYKCGVAVLDGEIYAIGGRNDVDRVSEVEVYNTVDDTWRSCAPMNEKRFGVATIALGNYIYAFGGSNNEGVLNSCERYDPKTDTWTFIKNSSFPREWTETQVLNANSIILAGGANSAGYDISDVESYDPDKDQWTFLASLVTPREQFDIIKVPWSPSKQASKI